MEVPKASKRKLEIKEDDNNVAKKRKFNEPKQATIVEAKPSVEISVSNTTASHSQVLDTISFKINEVVWAKIRGFPHWPAKIKAFSNKMVVVVWFNDYRTTKLYRSQLYKFLPSFDEFAKKFNDHIGLEKAAKEGLIYFGSTLTK